jgi:hypothetical protein
LTEQISNKRPHCMDALSDISIGRQIIFRTSY